MLVRRLISSNLLLKSMNSFSIDANKILIGVPKEVYQN